MPYYVYKVEQPRSLEHLETFEKYRDARTFVRAQREAQGQVEGIRMIFAKNTIEAEKLLLTPREERVVGED